MLEVLKKLGIHAAYASIAVVLITVGPIYYQYKFTKEQNARIAVLEKQVQELQAK